MNVPITSVYIGCIITLLDYVKKSYTQLRHILGDKHVLVDFRFLQKFFNENSLWSFARDTKRTMICCFDFVGWQALISSTVNV